MTLELAVKRTLRKGELEEVSLKEEVLWRQKKKKFKWIKEKNCNYKFFHRVANDMWNKKFIKLVVSKYGVVLDNIESISDEIIHHFGKLFPNPLSGAHRR